ncbi:MAG TPA: hypothetical protein VN634_21835 [Candidatus Limnocylindrales bacterium]|nr:hypothetical protein [Candidatus Limnocylindrales bacterium]
MSDRSKNRKIVFAAVAVVALVAVVFLRSGSGPSPGPKKGEDDATQWVDGDGSGASSPDSSRRQARALGISDSRSDDEAAEYLREQFGATIDNKRSQIKAIEKLINYLMKRYPDDWQSRLQALLAKAFPGLADQLYAQFQNMSSYNEWLKAHHDELAKMDPADRREALRDARSRFFGADAEEIFAETLKQDQIADAMAAIKDAHDTTVKEKLDTYMDAINDAFGEEAPQFIERRQTELLGRFVELPSVQDDLYAMSPEQRENELSNIRAAMGLDEQALTRWRTLDAERDAQWDTGEDYMRERDQIVKSSQGDEQARRLAELRTKTFGEDADTIRSEEDAGFFRFGHRRVYGKE